MSRARNQPCSCGSGKKQKLCCKQSKNRIAISSERDAMFLFNEDRQWKEREVKRWNQFAQTNPEAEPGDSIVQFARELRMPLGGKVPPAPPRQVTPTRTTRNDLRVAVLAAALAGW